MRTSRRPSDSRCRGGNDPVDRTRRADRNDGRDAGLGAMPASRLGMAGHRLMVGGAGRLGSQPPPHYDLSGPRLGATFSPRGDARSQFGWHFEHSAASNKRGPWFIVETVLLAGGVDENLFIPNGTLIFGIRLPNSFEIGVGPSVTLGGPTLAHSAAVVAIGHSVRTGGIRIPVNVALAMGRDGEERVSLMTGWAIRDPK